MKAGAVPKVEGAPETVPRSEGAAGASGTGAAA